MRLLILAALSIVTIGFTGCCGVMFDASSSSSAPASASIAGMRGTVYGGQQPIAYSNLQIWQVGTAGYGTGATPLIPAGSYFLGGASGCVASPTQVCYSGVETTSTGSFNVSGDYSCTAGAELYVTATGGQATPGSNNSAIALMVGYGPCGSSNNSTSLTLNEATTVATVYALAPFMPPTPDVTPWTVGGTPANQTGLVNAFNDIGTLVNVGAGTANTSTSSLTLPTAEIYTLADALAACVNSNTSTSTGCNTLFGYTPNTDGSTPGDTITATLNIARNPSRNVGHIIQTILPTAPFQPTITAATDFTLAATYTGSGLAVPTSVAVDADGNVWIANKGSSSNTSSITELSHTGAVLSGPSGFAINSVNLPSAIAIDTNGNAWIANAGNNTLSELSAMGTNVVGSPYSGGGLSNPTAVALDGVGDVWLTNVGNNSISEFSSSGAPVSNTGFTGAGLVSAVGIAINPH